MRFHNKSTFAVIFFLVCIIYSCAHNPYSGTNRAYREQSKTLSKILRPVPEVMNLDSTVSPKYAVGTTNFDLRKPNFVIIHHTAQLSCDATLKAFTLVSSKVSAHYVICKDGTVHHMLNDYLRAWQAGLSKWGNFTDINSSSIGIELDNNGYEPFAEPQIISLIKLLDTLKHKYAIPSPNFIGHGDIAPTRKNDPNVFFPWHQLADRGFGLWYDDTTNLSVPVNFDRLAALRIIGYDMKDSTASIRSFRRHFLSDSTGRTINKIDEKILYNLSKKYL